MRFAVDTRHVIGSAGWNSCNNDAMPRYADDKVYTFHFCDPSVYASGSSGQPLWSRLHPFRMRAHA